MFRPQSFQSQFGHKLDTESMIAMEALLKEGLRERDIEGNSKLHQLIKQDEDLDLIEDCIKEAPHELFILNKRGQTPLDLFVEGEILPSSSLDQTQDQEVQMPKVQKMRNLSYRQRNSTKIQDESTLKGLVEDEEKQSQLRMEVDQKYHSWFVKSLFVIGQMHRFHPHSSIRFLKQHNRLDLKYERSFTMAIKKNRTDLIGKFPANTIKSVYVTLSQLGDLR